MERGSQRRVRLELVPEEYRTPRPDDSGGVRWARVNAVRARIAAGYYDRENVRERVLDALLDELTGP
jgi:hypothetical protein